MDEQAFLNEIFAHPESDDALRVYADWLEDRGETDRARLIRVELERRALPAGDPRDSELMREQSELERRWLTLRVPAALRKKFYFHYHRALAGAEVRGDVEPTAADMRALGRLPDVKTLIDFDRLPTPVLAQLSHCPNIQCLKYDDRRELTAEDWQAITAMTQVQSLLLSGDGDRITDEDVRQLSAMTQLKELDLSGMAISDAGAAHLKNLKNLEVLKLAGDYYEKGRFTDAGLQDVSSLRKLRVLDLARTGITDAGLPHLLALKALTHLDLGRTRIKGDPVPVLLRLKKLRSLGLEELAIDDDNVKELTRLPALRELDLRNTNVTRFRLAALLPKTKWKSIRLETSLAIYGTHEQRELDAFEAYCREIDVFVEVDQE
jgi:uncharacterized protein (TIGR02996 family)